MERHYLQPGDRLIADSVLLRWTGADLELDPASGMALATNVHAGYDVDGQTLFYPVYTDDPEQGPYILEEEGEPLSETGLWGEPEPTA